MSRTIRAKQAKKLANGIFSTTFLVFFLATTINNDAIAIEGDNYSLSIFGTAGYAISDQPYFYDKINEHGTFDQDSKLGIQLDYQFNNKFSATVQAKLAPATDKDKRWRPELSWAFLSYRPSDDLLLRIGKLRIPSLLYTENMDVGMSYESAARLPIEVYKSSSIYDFWGISSSKSFELASGNSIVWDAYIGYAQFKDRTWINDSLPNVAKYGANYTGLRAKAIGTVVSWNSEDLQNTLRLGLHYASARRRDGKLLQKSPHRIDTPYGYYYNLDASLPGQGKKDLQILFFTLGAKWHLGNEFYFISEAVHRAAIGVKNGYDSNSFSLNLSKKIGKFTPYITFAWIKTDADVLRAINDMNVTQTGFGEYSARFNATNHIVANSLRAADQYSFMLGTSYNVSPHQRLKFEYMRTHIGKFSVYTDSVGSQPVRDSNINTFSMSYNFLF